MVDRGCLNDKLWSFYGGRSVSCEVDGYDWLLVLILRVPSLVILSSEVFSECECNIVGITSMYSAGQSSALCPFVLHLKQVNSSKVIKIRWDLPECISNWKTWN